MSCRLAALPGCDRGAPGEPGVSAFSLDGATQVVEFEEEEVCVGVVSSLGAQGPSGSCSRPPGLAQDDRIGCPQAPPPNR